MTNFIYSGPPSGVTLNEAGQSREVLLHDGHPVDLPEDNAYVAGLIARKHLTRVAEEAAASKTSKTKGKGAGDDS